MAFIGNGAQLTDLDAGDIASGTVPTARLASGTANSTTYLRGDQTWATVQGGPNPLHGRQVFTSSGTFSVPTGVTNVKVTVIGAGGNGGNGTNSWSDGGGGGAGGYVVDYVNVTSGGTASVTVGTNGGTRTSSFAGGSTITATGGSNGNNAPGYGDTSPVWKGADAPASVFGLTYYLGGVVRDGDNAFYSAGLAMSTTANTRTGGAGSCWYHGVGVGGATRSSSGSRQNPLGYGAGGGGGFSANPYTGGAAGSNGLVIVEW
jgi:hypothetical protein